MKAVSHIVPILAALLAFAALIPAFPAVASEQCLLGACTAHDKLFGGIGDPDVTKRGYPSWSDIYNQRNQERYKSGIEAKPFDFGSSLDRTAPSALNKNGTFNDDHPEARSEHVRWCLKRYRTYSVVTNTYVTYGGRTRFCDSPFD